MNVLIFEWKNFGIEDICDAFKDMAIKYKCISTELMRERKNEEFDNIFENEMSIKYDCVFTFNYSPVISNCCRRFNIPYMPYVFNNSRINLNISLRSIRSGIPLRAMDIMGCNGFLLSNYQADFYDFFVPGEDMAVFESKEDLINKCDYYLEHDNERRQIAANGFGKVNEFHTYKVRLKEIFDVVF